MESEDTPWCPNETLFTKPDPNIDRLVRSFGGAALEEALAKEGAKVHSSDEGWHIPG